MNQHIGAGFNAQQLFEYLATFSVEDRRERAIYIRVGERGSALNVRTLDFVEDSETSFFGIKVPCLVLNDERFSPREEV